MIEEKIQIHTPDGISTGVFFHAEDSHPRPGVIHFTDIFGIRPAQHEMALRLAGQGYSVLMPNVFYRTGRPPLFDFDRKPGDKRTMQRFKELGAPLTPEAVERDAKAYVDFLAAQDSVSQGIMGVVGYCFTGALVLRTTAARPDRIGAMASFHGGGLFNDTPNSPHLVLPRVRARLYFGHAVQDRSMPAEAIEKFEAALAAWGGQYQSETYEGAFHSWTVPDSQVYNQPQAERAFEKLVELFAETL